MIETAGSRRLVSKPDMRSVSRSEASKVVDRENRTSVLRLPYLSFM